MVLMACWCLCLWECIAQLETGTGGSCCLSSWGRQHGKKHIHGLMCFIFPSCVSILLQYSSSISSECFLNSQGFSRLMVQVREWLSFMLSFQSDSPNSKEDFSFCLHSFISFISDSVCELPHLSICTVHVKIAVNKYDTD